MSCATKAKAVAGDAVKGGAVVDKMALLNKCQGGRSFKNPKFLGGFGIDPDYREAKRHLDVAWSGFLGGLSSLKSPC